MNESFPLSTVAAAALLLALLHDAVLHGQLSAVNHGVMEEHDPRGNHDANDSDDFVLIFLIICFAV